MPKNVIVVGAPRSGTSMTANIFIQKGYHVTEETQNLQEADEFNPHGFWEAAELRRFNEEIFNLVGYQHPNTWENESISDSQAKAILSLEPKDEHRVFVDSLQNKQPWMWKDPSLCYTIGYWWPLMDSSTTTIILIRRNIEEVCNSFIRVNWCENTADGRSEALVKIQRHMDIAKEVLDRSNVPYLEIEYSDYETNADEIALRISEHCDLELTAKDLGYDRGLNSSKSVKRRGKDFLKNALPSSVKTILKGLIPNSLYK